MLAIVYLFVNSKADLTLLQVIGWAASSEPSNRQVS